MSDMKLILEGWRDYVNEQEADQLPADQPVTYGQFAALLKLVSGAKQGLVGDALSKASGIFKFFASGDAQALMKTVAGLIAEENKKTEKQLISEEPVTLALVLTGLGQAMTAVGAAKGLVGLGKKAYNKLRGKPTTVTDKAPFLDLFNVDPEYSKILDDRIEEEFLKFWLASIEGKNPNDKVDTNDLDVNLQLQRFLKSKFKRGITGHTAPGLASAAQSQAALAQAMKKIKKRSSAQAVKGIATAE